MLNAKMRRLHIRADQQEIARWLNKNKAKPRCKSVVRLIEEIQKAHKAIPKIFLVVRSRPGIAQQIDLINNHVRKFHLSPRIVGWIPSSDHFSWSSSTDDAARVVSFIVGLDAQGSCDSLIRCSHCTKWFFRKRDWQRFCSAACRDKSFRSSDGGRKKRASYMRKYRAQPHIRAGRRLQKRMEK